jgi:hypothetical protein
MSSDMARSMLGIEDEKMDPFTGAVRDRFGQCHAYNRLGFY